MIIILTAFSLFHLAVGFASLALAVRLLTPAERVLWRSPLNLLVAELLVWVYPVFAYVATRSAWEDHAANGGHGPALIMSPTLWLLFMGLVFAIVDFAEDGVLGNARNPEA